MRFLRFTEVRSRVPLSKAQIYMLMREGKFPRSHSIGARAVAWLESDINDWIAARIAETQAAQ